MERMTITTKVLEKAELLRDEFCFDLGFDFAEARGLDPAADVFDALEADLAQCGLLEAYTA